VRLPRSTIPTKVAIAASLSIGGDYSVYRIYMLPLVVFIADD